MNYMKEMKMLLLYHFQRKNSNISTNEKKNKIKIIHQNTSNAELNTIRLLNYALIFLIF